MVWLWIALGLLGLVLLAMLAVHIRIFTKYIPFVVSIFQERPFFIPPSGQPDPEAEDVDLPTSHDLVLKGCYLKSRKERRGVILFGLEFGSNRWAALPYCDFLRDAGYDVFAFEMRGQGESPKQPGYEPLQWVTDFEIEDFRAAVRHLKGRPDAEPTGIGFFGISKGGSAGLFVAAEEPWIRCCVTDGIFAARTTMVPYMQRWIHIYSNKTWIAKALPTWYYTYAANYSLRRIGKERRCTFPPLESVMPRLAPTPLLMIHGGGDNYIRPEMARELFERARAPKEFWLVDKAKHNQALDVAGAEYRRRVLAFFDSHLAQDVAPRNGVAQPGVSPHVIAQAPHAAHAGPAREQGREEALSS